MKIKLLYEWKLPFHFTESCTAVLSVAFYCFSVSLDLSRSRGNRLFWCLEGMPIILREWETSGLALLFIKGHSHKMIFTLFWRNMLFMWKRISNWVVGKYSKSSSQPRIKRSKRNDFFLSQLLESYLTGRNANPILERTNTDVCMWLYVFIFFFHFSLSAQ